MSFRTLPGFSALFQDYVEGALPAKSFFAGKPDPESLERGARRVPGASGDMQEMIRLLASQAERFESGPRSLENLELLRVPNAVCVLAGLAPDLFAGPLCGWLKALTAVRISSWLCTRGISAFPAIWIRSEIMTSGLHAGFLAADGPRRISRPAACTPRTQVPDSIEEWLRRAIPAGEDSEVFRRLASAYQPGIDFTLAWGRAMAKWFEPYGLVWIDPRDPAVAAEIDRRWPAEELVRAESLRREAQQSLTASGYGPVETEGPTPPAFWTCHRILPVAAIVTDEFEIAGRACDEAMLRALRLPAPILWPRISATLIDRRSRKILDRYGLTLENLFQGADVLAGKLLNAESVEAAALRMESLQGSMKGKLEQMAALVPSEDRMSARIKNTHRRMTYQMEKLKIAYSEAHRKRHLLIERRIPELCDALAPWGGLQEREFAGFDLLERSHSGLLHHLVAKITPWQLVHQEIEI